MSKKASKKIEKLQQIRIVYKNYCSFQNILCDVVVTFFSCRMDVRNKTVKNQRNPYSRLREKKLIAKLLLKTLNNHNF